MRTLIAAFWWNALREHGTTSHTLYDGTSESIARFGTLKVAIAILMKGTGPGYMLSSSGTLQMHPLHASVAIGTLKDHVSRICSNRPLYHAPSSTSSHCFNILGLRQPCLAFENAHVFTHVFTHEDYPTTCFIINTSLNLASIWRNGFGWCGLGRKPRSAEVACIETSLGLGSLIGRYPLDTR